MNGSARQHRKKLSDVVTLPRRALLSDASPRTVRLIFFVGLVVVVASLLWTTPTVQKSSPRFVEALCAGYPASAPLAPRPASNGVVTDSPLRTTPLPWFDSIRVITMSARAERRAHMQRIDDVLNLNFSYFEAVTTEDPRIGPRVERWKESKGWSHHAVPTQQACRLSHTDLLMRLEEANENATLIMEDDVDIELNFKHIAGTVLRDVPNDWDMIFFGHTNIPGVTSEYKHGLAKDAHNSHVYTSVEPRGGHAYAVSRSGRRLLLSMFEDSTPERAETDGGFPIDEYFSIVAQKFLGKIYTVLPDVVVQVSGFESDVSPGEFGKDDYHDKPLMDSTLRLIGRR